MTDQQQHLQSVLQQQKNLNDQLTQLNGQSTSIRDMILKLQGVVEYLTQLGVTLPQPEEVIPDEVTEEDKEEFLKRREENQIDRNPTE
jgi:predicted type IV restriction endonuclease